MIAPTKKQLELLDFIRAYNNENGVSPSISEMMKGTGMSRSLVTRRLDSLESKRRIIRADVAHRSVRIVY